MIQTKTLTEYVEEYINSNEEDFPNSKIEKLRNHNFNHIDVVGIFELIVADLNQGWKPNFISSKWEDWGYCIYYNAYDGVYSGAFYWTLNDAAGSVDRIIGTSSLFESKKLTDKAIEICGEDFLNLLFE
jgi:hypothetical protein